MTMIMKVKGNELEIKFNYKMLFMVNKQLSTKDENGQSQDNGAGQLFMDIIEGKDKAIHSIIEIANGKKMTENEIIDAVEVYAEEHGYEELFEELEREMLDSGFFMPKIEKTLDDMKFGQSLLASSELTAEEEMQQKAVKELVKRLEKKISSHNAPA